MGEPGRTENIPIDKPTYYLHEVVSFLDGVRDELIFKFSSGLSDTCGWGGQNLLDAFEERFGSKAGGLVTAVKVVKGDSPTIAINTNQTLPFYALYDIGSFDFTMREVQCRVSVDTNDPSPKIVEAKLKWFHRPGIPDDVLITKELGRILGVKDGENIVIWEAQNDETDVDLDK